MGKNLSPMGSLLVAPHAGAWIEIRLIFTVLLARLVAPHAGAWIEIARKKGQEPDQKRRPPRGGVD